MVLVQLSKLWNSRVLVLTKRPPQDEVGNTLLPKIDASTLPKLHS